MVNDKKNRFVYFESTSDLDALTETLDFYESQNLSSRMTNDEMATGEIQTPLRKAYSFRKLRVAYNGSAFRVRRSSDDQEKNIGFSGKYVDVTDYESFVGASDGYITTWYDQSGNEKDAVQETNADQPKISTVVIDGETRLYLDTKTGDPFMVTDGGDDYFNCNDYHEFTVALKDNTSFSILSGYANTGSSLIRDIVATSSNVRFRQNSVFDTVNYPETRDTNTIYEMKRESSTANPVGYLLTSIATETVLSPSTSSTNPLRYWYLATGDGNGANGFNGEIYEHIEYTTPLTEDVQTKQRNELLTFYNL